MIAPKDIVRVCLIRGFMPGSETSIYNMARFMGLTDNDLRTAIGVCGLSMKFLDDVSREPTGGHADGEGVVSAIQNLLRRPGNRPAEREALERLLAEYAL